MLTLGTFCVIHVYIFAFTLPHMAIMGKPHSNLFYTKFTAYKMGFLIQRIAKFIFCDNYFVSCRLCMGRAHLKIRYHKRGLGLKEDCVINMRDLAAS